MMQSLMSHGKGKAQPWGPSCRPSHTIWSVLRKIILSVNRESIRGPKVGRPFGKWLHLSPRETAISRSERYSGDRMARTWWLVGVDGRWTAVLGPELGGWGKMTCPWSQDHHFVEFRFGKNHRGKSLRLEGLDGWSEITLLTSDRGKIRS